MKNNTTVFSKMGIVLMLIGSFGVLNAIGDIVTLILMMTQSFDDNAFFSFFFGVFADKDLFLIVMPLTLLCNILFLVFMFLRKLLFFKLFFFASCIIALIHLSVNLLTLYPLTIFDIMISSGFIVLITGLINPMIGLLRTMYPVFMITGIFTSLGLLIVCFIYFKRSKQIAAYFG
jgi:hypothetical protein